MGLSVVGSEILVNTSQLGSQHEPKIASLANGGFVIAWEDAGGSGGDTNGFAVRAQVFAATGTPVGGEILVNSTTASDQTDPQITALSNGGFVVTWTDNSQSGGDTAGFAVRAQVFGDGGAPVGGEILVNTATASTQYRPEITALSNGGFVVTWTDFSGSGGDASPSAVRAQVFAATGAPVGTEILVNTATADDQYEQKITALSDGGFVITWRDRSETGGDTSDDAVRGQVFGAAGTPVGGEILVNTTTVGVQYEPQITALSNGGFVVAWPDDSQSGGDTSGGGVRAQVFAAAGAPVGSEILVNATTAGPQGGPQITALSNGGFVVTWEDDSQSGGDASDGAVRAQVFGADGTPVGTEILINTTTADDQFEPRITALADGGFVVTWIDNSQSGSDTSSYAVRAQVFDAGGTPLGAEISVNTTTANGQFNPNITALADGGFVITWEDLSQSGGDSSGSAVRAQVFAVTNDAPAGADATLTATEDSPLVLTAVDFGFSDADGDGLASVRITTLPASGILTNDGVAVTAGQSVSAADIAAGDLVFTPDDVGAASFTFQVQDDGGTANGGVDLDATPNTLTFNVSASPPSPPSPPRDIPMAGGEGGDFAMLSNEDNGYAGGGGADLIIGLGGDDVLQGNMGADSLDGGAGDDVVYGGKDDDLVDGGAGDDWLYGDLGNDQVLGGLGDDVIQGAAGNDLCDGGEGADTVRGGQGDDVIEGGPGDDWLSGDLGNDTLAGGDGADIFHIFAGAGTDQVTDFSFAGGDRIQLLLGTTYTVSQVGADTVMVLTGAQLVLQNVQLASLPDGWIFAA
jgi:Ca2+-binding RTX toxin-like protein